ncbi:MAG: Verru_Chthon cassette protein D [Chthoniobacteraceae bacterium]
MELPHQRCFYVRGFSLLELLIVMGIVGFLSVLVMPRVGGIMQGSSLSQSGLLIEDNLKFANQYARSHQCVVEVRFYQYKDSSISSSVGTFNAFQLLEMNDSGTYKALSSVVHMSRSNVIMADATYSPLLSGSPITPATGSPSIPGVGLNYTYERFSFLPNGQTDLLYTNPKGLQQASTQVYFISVAGYPTASQPANFYTIAVDPVNSKITSYRP